MLALVGNLVDPLACLCVDIGQIGEGSQRPEALAYIADGAFYFTFLPGSADMAGARNEAALAGEGEEAGIEAHQVSFVFGHGRGEVVEPDFARTAAEGVEGVEV